MTLDSMAPQSDISFYTAHKEHLSQVDYIMDRWRILNFLKSLLTVVLQVPLIRDACACITWLAHAHSPFGEAKLRGARHGLRNLHFTKVGRSAALASPRVSRVQTLGGVHLPGSYLYFRNLIYRRNRLEFPNGLCGISAEVL